MLDDVVTVVAGQTYACRFRREDGSSLLRSVTGQPGDTATLILSGVGDAPSAGDLAFFGPSSQESFACTVKAIEAMENFTARVTLVDHAPEIEALVDAEVPPTWSGRAGGDAQPITGNPLMPTITGIVSGRQAADSATDANPVPVIVLIANDLQNTVPVVTFNVLHRIAGASAWSTATGDAGSGAVILSGYARGNVIEIEAQAVSDRGALSALTASQTHTVSATDPAAPQPPQDLSAASYTSGVIRGSLTASGSAQGISTQVYIARGAATAFVSAAKLGAPINSGPNAPLTFEATGLAAGTYRIWATALDSNDPPIESVPAGPLNVEVT